MTHFLLDYQDLSIQRGGKPIINNMSFTCSEGDIYQIQGKNGIGKSTLIAGLVGLLTWQKGCLYYKGDKIQHMGLFQGECWYLPPYFGFRDSLNIGQHLSLLCDLHAIDYTHDFIDDILHKLQLLSYKNTMIKHLSSGQKRQVQLCTLLLELRPIWLLDEVFAELDQKNLSFWCNILQQYASQHHVTIIYISHHLLPLTPTKIIEL